MAKLTVEGLGIFSDQLNKLRDEIHKINRGALGEAAGYVADEIGSALESMPVRPDGSSEHRLFGATASEKTQIIDNFGIAKFHDTVGGCDTSVGFTGYVETPSKRFNNQVPTGMLMQCINYGTEFRQGTHTVDHAIKGVRAKVEKTVQNYIDDKTKEIIS